MPPCLWICREQAMSHAAPVNRYIHVNWRHLLQAIFFRFPSNAAHNFFCSSEIVFCFVIVSNEAINLTLVKSSASAASPNTVSSVPILLGALRQTRPFDHAFG